MDDVSKNSKSGISSDNNKESSSSDSDNDENIDNNFKIPLKERLKQKIINIGESPLPLENLSYGQSAKRELSDDSFSDLGLDYFDDKEKVED